jgi:hypothetical protein
MAAPIADEHIEQAGPDVKLLIDPAIGVLKEFFKQFIGAYYVFRICETRFSLPIFVGALLEEVEQISEVVAE